jgi:SET domain-containing protein
MFLIKTKIGPSKIHGTGVFADEFIPKGTIVWIPSPGLDIELTKEQVDKLPELAKKYVLKYSYKSFKCGNYVLCFDNTRYVNHSNNPNTADIRTNIPGEDSDIAIEDICEGEEITLDYQTMDLDFDKKMEMHS